MGVCLISKFPEFDIDFDLKKSEEENGKKYIQK